MTATRILEGPRGRYLLEARHGDGSAATFRGRREADGRPVFVKVLRLDRLPSWRALEIFEREATVLRALDVPGVPAWIDDFPYGPAEAPRAFVLVTELASGRTLRAITRAGGLSREASYRWLDEVLAVLEHLHARTPPIVHRDVAPKNIVVRDDGGAVLVDFGSIQSALRAAEAHQPTAAGTFGYAPPEQFLGRAVPASDLYGLGMSYLSAATGLEPEQMPLEGPKVAVRELLTGDPRLVRLIEAMTDPDPRRRPGATAARRSLGQIRGTALAPLGPRAAASLTDTTDEGEPGPIDPEVYATALEGRLLEQDFKVEHGGELARTALLLRAERRVALGHDTTVFVARSEHLEGVGAGRRVDAAPAQLFVAAAAGQAFPKDLLAQIMATPPVVLVVLIARDGVGPLVPGRVERSARRHDGTIVLVAFVDLARGQVSLVTPSGALDTDRHGVRAWAEALVRA